MHADTSADNSDHTEEDLVPANYHWIRFKWMLWIGCCRHWNKRVQYLLAILMPTILSLIVVILRIELSTEHITATSWYAEDLKESWKDLLLTIKKRQKVLKKRFGTPIYSTFTPQLIIGYAPDSDFNAQIMAFEQPIQTNVAVIKFKTCDELREEMSIQHYLAGVCFKEEYQPSAITTGRYGFSLIFPSELRIYKGKIGETWDTNNLFQLPNLYEHINGFTNYIDEGFMMLQKLISQSYINMLAPNKSTTQYLIRKFPVQDHDYDPLSEELQMRMSLLLVLGYMSSISHLLRALVVEREKKLEGLLAILDVTLFIQFYSWFAFTFISMSISSLILLLVLKIPWNNGFAIYNDSSFTCLYVVFSAFNIYALSFCYIISKFFRQPKKVISAAPIFWILSYLPFASTIDASSTLVKTLHPILSLFGSSAFGFAIQRINRLENVEGLNWSNYFKTSNMPTEGYSVGTYTLIMLGVSIFQILIGICVPKFDKCLQTYLKKIAKTKRQPRDSETSTTRYSKTIILEVRTNHKPTALEVIALTVEDGNKLILDDISFSLYEDEITMLMGHNGSGKTTLIQVLAGIRRPKSGKVIYPGSNDYDSYSGSRDYVGVCFSDTLLFYDLNVKHQLMFFGQMKGLSKVEAKKETSKYLEALELRHHRYFRTEELTCGQRTKLAVACALIGGSKVILLDDIVLKLDEHDHQLTWKLLETEKFGRMILASTNLSLALELHADNLIILGQGRLKCVGSGQFLKSIYCFGCHLLISKGAKCNIDEITKIVAKYIPDITPSSNIGRELTYTIETSKIGLLEHILKEVESKQQKLGILNLTIVETPVEELFCKLGSERPCYDDRKQFMRLFNGLSFTSEEDDEFVFLKKRIHYEMSIFKKILNQWIALFYKYFVLYWAYKSVIPVVIFLPLFFIIYFGITIVPHGVKQNSLLSFEIGNYDDSINLIRPHSGSSPESIKFIDIYKQYIYWKNSNIKMITVKDETINHYITTKENNNEYGVLNMKIILGLAVYNDTIVGWFNGYLPHIAPVALNLLHNAVLRSTFSTDAQITVSLELLPLKNEVNVGELSGLIFSMGAKLAVCLAFIACYLVSIRVMVLVSERTNGLKSLQNLAGVTSCNYWISLFIDDFLRHFIVVTLCMVVLRLLYPEIYISQNVLGWFYKLLLLFCTAISSFNYMLSFFFNNGHQAYLVITSFHIVGLAFFIAFYGDVEEEGISYLPRIFPLYSYCMGLHNVYENNIRELLCEDKVVQSLSVFGERCQKVPDCCGKEYRPVEEDAMWLWLVIVNSWLGVLMFECCGFFSREVPFDNYDRALDEHKRRHAKDSINVDDVTGEMIHVRTLKPQKRYFYKAICENLGLIDKKKILVDRVSLTIKPGDSLGVFGTNCINAHALINLLAGNTKPSFGRLYINGVSMTDDPKKAKAHIGYIPTYCIIMEEMTCYQALKMFCILYGYAFDEIDEICENLSKNLGFYTQLHEPLMKCSPGITDRISYSIAALKKPSLLCICNYSWSVDPIGRRQWTRLLVALIKERGTATAMTWVHNCHTEIVCNKIVVMNEGQFTHIGHPSEIAPELMKGYVVLMRMKKYIQTPQGVMPKVLFHLTTYMEDKFPTSYIIQEGTIMQYFIPHQGTTFGFVYKNLRDNLFNLNIESISITSMNMSYVFGRLTEETIRKSNTEDLGHHRYFFQS